METTFEFYAQLYRKYINELYSYALGLGYTENVAMDAIHDVFCGLVVSGKNLGEIDNIKFYLFKSIKNRLLDMHKRGGKLTYSGNEEPYFSADISFNDDTLVDREERDRLVKKVQSLMDTLTPTQREAIYLRYIQEMNYDEIAAMLNITPESVRKLVYRSIDKLRNSNVGILGAMFFVHMLKQVN